MSSSDVKRIGKDLDKVNKRLKDPKQGPKILRNDTPEKKDSNKYVKIGKFRCRKCILFAIIIFSLAAIYFVGPSMNAFVVAEFNLREYSQEVSWVVGMDSAREWVMAEHPEEFLLRSVKISGQMLGGTDAKVYLEHEGEKYLLFDGNNAETDTIQMVTAYVSNVPDPETEGDDLDAEVSDADQTDPALTGFTENNETGENLSDAMVSMVEDLDIEGIDGNVEENETGEGSETGEENETGEDSESDEEKGYQETPKNITLSLGYQKGTRWDADDNGIAYKGRDAIDFTVNETGFNWEVDQSRLCTEWTISNQEGNTNLCHGAADCCALVDLAPSEPSWDSPFYIYYGAYNSIENNTVSARVIYLDQSLEPDDIHFESVQSETQELRADFEEVKQAKRFSQACQETCSLPDLNASRFNISFEIEEGMLFLLENITYVTTGRGEDIKVDVAVKDSKGQTLPALIQIKDKAKRVKAQKEINKTGKETRGLFGLLEEDNSVEIEQGTYDVDVNFTNETSPVESIELKDVEMKENSEEFVKFEDVEEDDVMLQGEGFDEVFAVDPSKVNFTSGKLKVKKAKGGWLYKCRDWDFELQECPELQRTCTGNTKDTRNCTLYGGWKKTRKLEPGEAYEINISPVDPGFAEHNSTWGAPYCEDGTSPCIASSSLLNCRDSVSDGNGPEPNQPNTIDTCTDGTTTYSWPSCGGDESVENITVTDQDNSHFRGGDTVVVEAWVHCYSSSDDKVAVVYASDAQSPQWEVKEYKACSQADPSGSYHKETFTAFTLDDTAGDHAVRVYIQYKGESGETCADSSGGTGTYDDNDDVVFYVNETSTGEQESEESIFFESFESASLSGWTITHPGGGNDWTIGSSHPYQGSHFSYANPQSTNEPASLIERTVSTSNYTNITFNYCRRIIGLDSADEFKAKWYDGTSWTVVEETGSSSANDGDYVCKSFSLGTDAVDNEDFKIRFECTAGATSEYCLIDNVELAGELMPDITPPGIVTSLTNQSADRDWIYWTWNNPEDEDFSEAIIYLNDSNVANTSGEAYNTTGLTSGTTYELKINTKDEEGNVNDTEITATGRTVDDEDLIPPGTITNLGENSVGKTWIRWVWTNPDDEDFSQALLYLNGSNDINTSNNYYNFSNLTCCSTYQLIVHTKDSAGNINNTDVADNANTLDGTEPEYSNIKDENGTSYSPGKSYQFNITWTDNIAVDEVWFEFEGTNYTNPSSAGDEYYISMSNLAAGNYEYRWFADDFLDNMAETGYQDFTIEKAVPDVTMTATPSWTESYGTPITINCSDDGAPLYLYRNETQVSNPYVANLAVGQYGFVCNNTETQNYTGSLTSNNLTVIPSSSEVNLLLDGIDDDVIIERKSSVNISLNLISGANSTVEISRNGSLLKSGMSPQSIIYQFNETGTNNLTGQYPGSENYSSSSETHWITVEDTTAPGLVTGLAESEVGQSWVTWAWSNPEDDDYSHAMIYLDGEYQENVSQENASTESGNRYNATGLDCYTNYTLTVRTVDDYGNIDGNVTDTAQTLDSLAPIYSGIKDCDGRVYDPEAGCRFNITWTDNAAVETVVLEVEGTNYTNPSNTGDEYYYVLEGPAAGNYTYRWHASDNAGNWNSTEQQEFIIEKAVSILNITANPSWNETYGTETTISCMADNQELDPQLYRNGTLVSNPETGMLGGGTWHYTCNANQTQNYTSASDTTTLTINKAVPSISLLLNGSSNDITIETGTQVNKTGLHDHPCMLEIYEDGELTDTGSSPLTKMSFYHTLGDYNITLKHPESQNHSAVKETHWIRVRDTTSPEIALESPDDAHETNNLTTQFRFNLTDNYYSTANCTLYINGTGQETIQATTESVNTVEHTFTEGNLAWYLNCTDISGNTGQSETRNIIVDNTAPVITPVRPVEGETIGYILYFEVDLKDNLAGIHTFYVESRNSTGDIVFAGVVPYPYRLAVNTSIYADGQYNLTAWVNDTLGNTAQRSVIHYIDNSHPFIQINTPEEGSKWNENFNLSVVVQDDSLDIEIHNITSENGSVILNEESNLTSETYHIDDEEVNVSGLADGNYTLNVWVRDSVGYEDNASVNFLIDRTAPAHSSIQEPEDPSTYNPGNTYGFNITWTDLNGLDNVKLEFNGANHTTTSQGDTYKSTLSGLGAGQHQYRWHATDTVGNTNQTALMNFTVLKASSSCLLSFDNISPLVYGIGVTVDCICTNAEGSERLWRNQTDVTLTEIGQETFLAAEDWNYVCNVSETANYTSAMDTAPFTVYEKTTYLSLEATPSWSNVFGTETTVTCDADNEEVTPQLKLDGVPVSHPHTITLPAGDKNYTCTAEETQNYTSAENTSTMSIDKADSSVSLSINGNSADLTVERTSTVNISGSRIIGEGPVELYRDGELLDTGTTVQHSADYDTEAAHNMTIKYPETQNYSESSQTLWLTVDDTIAPGSITNLELLNRKQSYLYWVWTNPTDADFDHVEIYIDGEFRKNRTDEYYYATGLQHSTNYTLSLRTVDRSGTKGSWTNTTERTAYNCTEDWTTRYTECQSNDTRIKYYADRADCGIYFNLPEDNGSTVACDYVVSTEYLGNESFNFTREDLTEISGIVLEKSGMGKIEFLENITINRSLDINSYSGIAKDSVSFDSDELPEFNRSARITLYNISSFSDPRITADGTVCTSCTILNHSTVENNETNISQDIITFTVPHFTNYTVEETPQSSGTTRTSGGGGGGGSGGSAGNKWETCEPNWLCYSWTPCVNNRQSRTCFDANNCGNETGKPETERFCVAGCTEDWVCEEWGKCTESGVQTRTCKDMNSCGTEKQKPETVQPCEYDYCSDGKQNNNETGIDCGGTCRPCTEEEIEAAANKGRGDQLTGKSIEVGAYEVPNPVYVLPMFFLLVLLVAVIALRKSAVNEKMKKVVTALHIMLIVMVLVMLIMTFDVPEVTGRVVSEYTGASSLTGVIVSVIALSVLIGGFSYATFKKTSDQRFLDKMSSKSKYWAGYAMQKVKWKKKKDPRIMAREYAEKYHGNEEDVQAGSAGAKHRIEFKRDDKTGSRAQISAKEDGGSMFNNLQKEVEKIEKVELPDKEMELGYVRPEMARKKRMRKGKVGTSRPKDVKMPAKKQNDQVSKKSVEAKRLVEVRKPAETKKPIETERSADTKRPLVTEGSAEVKKPVDVNRPEVTKGTTEVRKPAETGKTLDKGKLVRKERPVIERKKTVAGNQEPAPGKQKTFGNKGSGNLKEKFGTDDPLEIAEMILKKTHKKRTSKTKTGKKKSRKRKKR